MWTYKAHKKTRTVVEQGIGQMKRRFHVLHGEVRLTPDKVSKVLTACAIFHNTCKARQVPEPLENSHGDSDEDEDDNEENHPTQGSDLSQSGLPYRAQFTNLHYRQVTVNVI